LHNQFFLEVYLTCPCSFNCVEALIASLYRLTTYASSNCILTNLFGTETIVHITQTYLKFNIAFNPRKTSFCLKSKLLFTCVLQSSDKRNPAQNAVTDCSTRSLLTSKLLSKSLHRNFCWLESMSCLKREKVYFGAVFSCSCHQLMSILIGQYFQLFGSTICAVRPACGIWNRHDATQGRNRGNPDFFSDIRVVGNPVQTTPKFPTPETTLRTHAHTEDDLRSPWIAPRNFM